MISTGSISGGGGSISGGGGSISGGGGSIGGGRPDRSAPIGIFDSGFGGLTVARAVIDQLPYEDIVYVGDSARAPYGEKLVSEVREYALECLDHLVDQGVKMLVIACNSASAAVLADARERYRVPVVEVIRPAARRAAAASPSGRVGVICTEATATARAYDDALSVAAHVRLSTRACPALVPYVEAGITTGDDLLAVVRDYLAPLQRDRIDTLILGCTHYPLLTAVISYVLGDGVTLVSSADECAKQTWATLAERDLLQTEPRAGRHRFVTTGSVDQFTELGRRLMGEWICDVSQLV